MTMPMKPRPFGGPHEALADAMDQIGVAAGQGAEAGVPVAAAFLGVSKFTLYKQLDPDNETTELSWPRLWQLVDRYKCRAPVEALADLIGCKLVTLPRTGAATTEVSALLHIAKESTEVLSTGWAALADNKLTAGEKRNLRKQISDAVEALLELDARLEGDA